jgi:hypothetical protein
VSLSAADSEVDSAEVRWKALNKRETAIAPIAAVAPKGKKPGPGLLAVVNPSR